MENLINCPGLHHIAEEIFSNLTLTTLEDCKKVNKSWELILKNPLFLKKRTLFLFRKCSQHKKFGNKNAWKETIQLNMGTNLQKGLTRLLEEIYKHLELCQTDLMWCCMNMNNELLGFWYDRRISTQSCICIKTYNGCTFKHCKRKECLVKILEKYQASEEVQAQCCRYFSERFRDCIFQPVVSGNT